MSHPDQPAHGMYTYPWDYLDEGIDTVLDAIQQRAGLNTVYVATWYHSGMFFTPHNPKRKVLFPEPGALYLDPSDWHRSSTMTPPVSTLSDDWTSFWHALRDACDARAMTLCAWMPVLHNTGLGTVHRDKVVTNAWGDPIIHSLCASHHEVDEVVRHIVGDVVRLGAFDRILLESIEYLPLQHGYHHEVIGVNVEPHVAFATSLCFCAACDARARRADVDVGGLRRWVQREVHATLNEGDEAIPATLAAFRDVQDGAMGSYLDLRAKGLTDLLAHARDAVTEPAPRLAILDFGPLYPLGQHDGVWQSGVDLAGQGTVVDEVHPTFYFDDVDVLKAKVAAYRDAVRHAGDVEVIPALRAIVPQVDGPEALQRQVQEVRGLGSGVSFYNYSFMHLDTLDWIRASLQDAQP